MKRRIIIAVIVAVVGWAAWHIFGIIQGLLVMM